MTRVVKAKQWVAPALIAGFMGACIAETGTGGDEPLEPQAEEPGKTVQALGPWTELWVGQSEQISQVVLDVGQTYTVVRNQRLTPDAVCDSAVTVLNTADGTIVDAPPFKAGQCPLVSAGGSDSSTIFVADGTGIFKTTPGATSWSFVTSQSPHLVDTILVNSTHVYYGGGSGAVGGIYRASRQGGASSLVSPAGSKLLGIDETSVYFERSSSNSRALIKVPLLSTSETQLATTTGFFADASLQGSYIYFVEMGSTNRLRRVRKDNGSLKDLRSSTSVKYRFPVSNGSALYWREEPVGGPLEDAHIRRQNLTNGNIVIEDFSLPLVTEMTLREDGVYAAGVIADPMLKYVLRRSPL